MSLICAQEDHVARTGAPLSESFLPLKSSDAMVLELRKWLDHVGHGMPHFTGWKKLKVLGVLDSYLEYAYKLLRSFVAKKKKTRPVVLRGRDFE